MSENEFKQSLKDDPGNHQLRKLYATWPEKEGRADEASFHRMVCKGLICDHSWEKRNDLLVGQECDMPVGKNFVTVVLTPGAWLQICKLCGMLKFDQKYCMLE